MPNALFFAFFIVFSVFPAATGPLCCDIMTARKLTILIDVNGR